MNKDTFEALERIINQIGGGRSEEFRADLAQVKEWARAHEFSTYDQE